MRISHELSRAQEDPDLRLRERVKQRSSRSGSLELKGFHGLQLRKSWCRLGSEVPILFPSCLIEAGESSLRMHVNIG